MTTRRERQRKGLAHLMPELDYLTRKTITKPGAVKPFVVKTRGVPVGNEGGVRLGWCVVGPDDVMVFRCDTQEAAEADCLRRNLEAAEAIRRLFPPETAR